MKTKFSIFLITIISISTVTLAKPVLASWEGISSYCTGTRLNADNQEVPDGSCTLCDGIKMLNGILNFIAFDLALPLGMLSILIAGVMYMFAGANPSWDGKAKNLLKTTAYGIALIFGAWLIINTILTFSGISGIQGVWNPSKWFVITCS